MKTHERMRKRQDYMERRGWLEQGCGGDHGRPRPCERLSLTEEVTGWSAKRGSLRCNPAPAAGIRIAPDSRKTGRTLKHKTLQINELLNIKFEVSEL